MVKTAKKEKIINSNTNNENNDNYIIQTNEELLQKHIKKSDVLCITTFNKTLYEKYAHNFIETYNFPFDLIVYGEDDLSFIKNKVKYNITIVNSTLLIPEMNEFIKNNSERNIIDVENNGFKCDGIRFCYKIFAVTHAGLLFSNYKYLIWLDADIIFIKSLTLNIIEQECINNNYMMSFLGRIKKSGGYKYSECGILFFNMNHQYIKEYFKEMFRMYISNDIYKLKEWHDSFIWDYVRFKFEKEYNITNFSICGYKIIKNVFDNCILKDYVRHLKGDRKYNI